MGPSEIKELKERFSKAVSFSIMLAVLTNIVSFVFVIGSEAWSESFTPSSIQPFYEFEDKPSEKLHRSRASWLSSNEEELAPILPQETYSQ